MDRENKSYKDVTSYKTIIQRVLFLYILACALTILGSYYLVVTFAEFSTATNLIFLFAKACTPVIIGCLAIKGINFMMYTELREFKREAGITTLRDGIFECPDCICIYDYEMERTCKLDGEGQLSISQIKLRLGEVNIPLTEEEFNRLNTEKCIAILWKGEDLYEKVKECVFAEAE